MCGFNYIIIKWSLCRRSKGDQLPEIGASVDQLICKITQLVCRLRICAPGGVVWYFLALVGCGSIRTELAAAASGRECLRSVTAHGIVICL